MADLSSLTREQLLELLKQKDVEEKQPIPEQHPSLIGKPCHFRPTRSNQKQCTGISITDWGFCKRHSRTVQAKRAREIWEAQDSKEEQIEEVPIVYPPAKIVEPVQPPAPVQPTIPVQPISTDIDEEITQLTAQIKNVDIEENKSKKKAAKTLVRPQVEMTSKTKKPRRKRQIKTKKIKPNHFGRYEDTDSHIVFEPASKRAYGVQLPNGDLGALTANHIAICNKNGWGYVPPVSSSEEEEEYESDETSSEDSYDSSEEESSEEYEYESSDEYYSSE